MRFVVFVLGFLTSLLTVWTGFAIFLFGTTDAYQDWPNTGLFMILAGCYGLLGAFCALFRCAKQGAVLMLVPVLLTAALNLWSLPVSGWQLIPALLSLMVGPLPIKAPMPDGVDGTPDDI